MNGAETGGINSLHFGAENGDHFPLVAIKMGYFRDGKITTPLTYLGDLWLTIKPTAG